MRRALAQSQASALKKRGDLSEASFCFEVQLPVPGAPAARRSSSSSRVTRLGLDIRRRGFEDDRSKTKLDGLLSEPAEWLVTEVDRNHSRSTAVAVWNFKEGCRAVERGSRRQSLTIRPGDIISAVNGVRANNEAIIDDLAAENDNHGPVGLTVERLRSDVLVPRRPQAAVGSVEEQMQNPQLARQKHPERNDNISIQLSSASPIECKRPRCMSSPAIGCTSVSAPGARLRRPSINAEGCPPWTRQPRLPLHLPLDDRSESSEALSSRPLSASQVSSFPSRSSATSSTHGDLPTAASGRRPMTAFVKKRSGHPLADFVVPALCAQHSGVPPLKTDSPVRTELSVRS